MKIIACKGKWKPIKRRYDYSPEIVIADTLYGSRDNRNFPECNPICLSGKPPGRSLKGAFENKDEMKHLKAQRRQGYRQRIPIEGKFGQGKNGYRLNDIYARRADTSLAWTNSIFPTTNLCLC